MLIAFTLVLALQQTPPPRPPQLPPCDSRPQARQFDFWVGEWDVFVKGKPAGINRIEKILNGCVLQENWTSAGGTEGKSWNWYDIGDGKWHQLWLASQGPPALRLSGSFADSIMKYEGTSIGPGGVTQMNRLQFFKLADDEIRQLWSNRATVGKRGHRSSTGSTGAGSELPESYPGACSPAYSGQYGGITPFCGPRIREPTTRWAAPGDA